MFQVSEDIMQMIFITLDENQNIEDCRIGDGNYVIETACSGCYSGCVGSCLNMCSGSGRGATGAPD